MSQIHLLAWHSIDTLPPVGMEWVEFLAAKRFPTMLKCPIVRDSSSDWSTSMNHEDVQSIYWDEWHLCDAWVYFVFKAELDSRNGAFRTRKRSTTKTHPTKYESMNRVSSVFFSMLPNAQDGMMNNSMWNVLNRAPKQMWLKPRILCKNKRIHQQHK